uniref:Serine aminopeptidase S33 domain-containing protein n=1 Tax=viral metagenome TaxID=1070528 RepID=A0A6C0J9H4_9ZZZZ
MNIIEFNILKNNNVKLNVLTHKLDNPKYIVIHLHGLHSSFQSNYESPDCFKNRIEILKENSILSYGLEFSGHGKSEGKKASVKCIDDLLADVDSLVKYIKLYHDINDRKKNHIPIYLLAESFGGSVAIKYSYIYNNISGLILLSPLCGFSTVINNCSVTLLKWLSYVYPNLDLNKINIKKELLTISKEYEKSKIDNQYNFTDRLTLCSIRECYLFINWLKTNRSRLNIPLLIFHSENDSVTNFKATEKFFNKCLSSDKELVKFQNNVHSLLIPHSDNDRTPNYILNKIKCWIQDINYKKI